MSRPCPDRRGRVACVAILSIGLAVAGCHEVESARVLRVAHGLAAAHPVHRALEFMAERVDALSAGSLTLQIHPAEQLGSERECIELLQIGSLALTKVSASVLENFVPAFRVFGVPYLFRDEAHRFAVLDGPIGRELLREGIDRRLHGLAYFDSGARSFYTTTRVVEGPDDLRGLKIRTQESATAIAMVRAFGAAATPLSWGELYTALQQGVVDGAENNLPSYYLSRHYEVAPHYVLDEHTAVPDVLLVSESVWERLTPPQRDWLSQAAREAADVQRELWRVATEEARRAVTADGATISATDTTRFAAASARLRRDLAADAAQGMWIRRIEDVGR